MRNNVDAVLNMQRDKSINFAYWAKEIKKRKRRERPCSFESEFIRQTCGVHDRRRAWWVTDALQWSTAHNRLNSIFQNRTTPVLIQDNAKCEIFTLSLADNGPLWMHLYHIPYGNTWNENQLYCLLIECKIYWLQLSSSVSSWIVLSYFSTRVLVEFELCCKCGRVCFGLACLRGCKVDARAVYRCIFICFGESCDPDRGPREWIYSVIDLVLCIISVPSCSVFIWIYREAIMSLITLLKTGN